ncbi:unnamed protein product [Rotaria sp. Silwood2]|nr:unnamed protein product [Rotaria sp. Silwood2]
MFVDFPPVFTLPRIVRSQYQIRCLTRDATSEKAQAVKRLSDDTEMVSCDINKKEDVQRAFKDSWAVFAVTDFWAQPDKPEAELQQVTGVPASAKALTEEEYRSNIQFLPKLLQDELFAMFQWFQEHGYYGKDKDWTTGQKVTPLNTFEQWLKKTGWKGE